METINTKLCEEVVVTVTHTHTHSKQVVDVGNRGQNFWLNMTLILPVKIQKLHSSMTGQTAKQKYSPFHKKNDCSCETQTAM